MRLFTDQQIEEIKALQGLYTQQQIAEQYGVDRRRIGEVFNRANVMPAKPTEIHAKPPKFKMSFWSNV